MNKSFAPYFYQRVTRSDDAKAATAFAMTLRHLRGDKHPWGRVIPDAPRLSRAQATGTVVLIKRGHITFAATATRPRSR
jgi:hypothetical protein